MTTLYRKTILPANQGAQGEAEILYVEKAGVLTTVWYSDEDNGMRLLAFSRYDPNKMIELAVAIGKLPPDAIKAQCTAIEAVFDGVVERAGVVWK